MQILLPPSETKRVGGAPALAAATLSRHEALGTTRALVRSALEAVSAEEAPATKALKLGVKNRDERLQNLALDASGVLPAIERYTGVLYDAIDVVSVDSEAREWLEAHVSVQSALFGLLGAGEGIPAYRLSGGSRLPELPGPLARVWAPAHAGALAGTPYVLDLRSKDYAALAPLSALGAQAGDFVEVVARSADGEVRALNHFNKAAKGALVRELALAAPHITNRAELLAWGEKAGVEFVADDESATIRLVTTQGVPAQSR